MKYIITTLLLISILSISPVQAQSEDGIDIDVNIPIDKIVDAINQLTSHFTEFTGDITQILIDAIIQFLYTIAESLAEVLIEIFTLIITSYPDVTDNAVLEVHNLVFQLELILAGAAFIGIGIAYLLNDILWIKRLWPMIPWIIAAIIFGGLAPWLLKYPVEISEALTIALKPATPDLWSLLHLSSELIIVALLESFVLLGIASLFIIRNIYLLLAVAIAPLLALGYSVPYFRRFASPLIGAFWGFLLIGPVDMVIFRLILALLEVDEFLEFPHWLLAFGGIILMLAVPFVILSSGATISGYALSFVGGATLSTTTNNYQETDIHQEHPRGGRDRNRFSRDSYRSRGDSYR